MGRSVVVVDTGVPLPAGFVRGVDKSEVDFVSRTKDDIRNAPECDESADRDHTHRSALGAYLGRRRPGLPRLGRRRLSRLPSAPSVRGDTRRCVGALDDAEARDQREERTRERRLARPSGNVGP